MGDVPPLKGEPRTPLRLPEPLLIRKAAMALASGIAIKALPPVDGVTVLLPPPPQPANQTTAATAASQPVRLLNVIKFLPNSCHAAPGYGFGASVRCVFLIEPQR